MCLQIQAQIFLTTGADASVLLLFIFPAIPPHQKTSAKICNINGEREIPGRQKVVRGSNVQVLTSHAGLNPRSESGYEREARVIKNLWCDIGISKEESLPIHKTDSPS